MRQYLDLLQRIWMMVLIVATAPAPEQERFLAIKCGLTSPMDFRFDHQRLHIKSIIHELLWFISGDTNIRYLQETACRSGMTGRMKMVIWGQSRKQWRH